jgi:hypothetical protein
MFHKTTIIAVVNPFQYMLTRWVIGGKISRWIVILQEFDLDFVSTKSKKSLVFTELISELPVELGDIVPKESPICGDMFFITSLDPWYGDILIYLQNLKCPTLLLVMSVGAYAIRLRIISYSMIRCIKEV